MMPAWMKIWIQQEEDEIEGSSVEDNEDSGIVSPAELGNYVVLPAYFWAEENDVARRELYQHTILPAVHTDIHFGVQGVQSDVFNND